MKGLLLIVHIATIGIIVVSGRSVKNENAENKRLIKTSESDPGKWMTENEIFELIQRNQGFMDITDFQYTNSDTRIKDVHIDAIPTAIRFNGIVQALIAKLETTRAEQFLLHFSSYFNRYYNSATGRESQLWLLTQVREAVHNYPGVHNVTEVNHGYLQQSIVARLEGADPTLKNQVVIIGGHLDSVASGGARARSPGADDNGSGSAVVLETLRAIVESGVILKRTVEFHWYAAEEIGLRGSQAIAQDYRSKNINVVGMLNLDVVGYHVVGIDDIAIYTDYANPQLVQLSKILTDSYLDFGRRIRTCGYGCSDHSSFIRNNFPAVFIAEAVDTPHMHKGTDTMATVNMHQINEFVKFTIGFAVELGEPVSRTQTSKHG